MIDLRSQSAPGSSSFRRASICDLSASCSSSGCSYQPGLRPSAGDDQASHRAAAGCAATCSCLRWATGIQLEIRADLLQISRRPALKLTLRPGHIWTRSGCGVSCTLYCSPQSLTHGCHWRHSTSSDRRPLFRLRDRVYPAVPRVRRGAGAKRIRQPSGERQLRASSAAESLIGQRHLRASRRIPPAAHPASTSFDRRHSCALRWRLRRVRPTRRAPRLTMKAVPPVDWRKRASICGRQFRLSSPASGGAAQRRSAGSPPPSSRVPDIPLRRDSALQRLVSARWRLCPRRRILKTWRATQYRLRQERRVSTAATIASSTPPRRRPASNRPRDDGAQ